MKPPTIWLIGDFTSAEFSFAAAGIDPHVQPVHFASILKAIDAQGATACLPSSAEQPSPEVIVVAQPRPGAIGASDIERLHAAQPLARLIMLLGAWCEGEMRTGYPIGGMTRMFWHAFPVQINRLLSELASGHWAPWAFPRIAGLPERLLREIPAGLSTATDTRGSTLLIRAANFTAFDILAEGLGSDECQWLDPQQPVRFRAGDCLIWNAPQLDRPEWELLASCRAAMPPTPIILLAGFPRHDDLLQARTLGVQALVAKPYLLADLTAAVTKAVKPSAAVTLSTKQIAG